MPGVKKWIAGTLSKVRKGKSKGFSLEATTQSQIASPAVPTAPASEKVSSPVAPPRKPKRKAPKQPSTEEVYSNVSQKGSSGYESNGGEVPLVMQPIGDEEALEVRDAAGDDFGNYLDSDSEDMCQDEIEEIEELQTSDWPEENEGYVSGEESLGEDAEPFEGLEQQFLNPVDESGFYASNGFLLDVPNEADATIYNMTYAQTKAGCQDDGLEAGQNDELSKQRATHWWNVKSMGCETVYADDDNIMFREKRPDVITSSRSDMLKTVADFSKDTEARESANVDRFKKHRELNAQRLYNTLGNERNADKSTLSKMKKGVTAAFRTLGGKSRGWSNTELAQAKQESQPEEPQMRVAHSMEQILY